MDRIGAGLLIPAAQLAAHVLGDHRGDRTWDTVRLLLGEDGACRATMAGALVTLVPPDDRETFVTLIAAGAGETALAGVSVEQLREVIVAAGDLPPERCASAMLSALGRSSGVGYTADAVEAWRHDARALPAEPPEKPKRGWFRR